MSLGQSSYLDSFYGKVPYFLVLHSEQMISQISDNWANLLVLFPLLTDYSFSGIYLVLLVELVSYSTLTFIWENADCIIQGGNLYLEYTA